MAGVTRCFRLRTASKPSPTSCLRTRNTIEALVSSAVTIKLSLHPSPLLETSAFNRMRAFKICRAGLLPLLISARSRSRSPSLNRTTYVLTAMYFAIVASIAAAIEANHQILAFGRKRPTRLGAAPDADPLRYLTDITAL